MVELIEGTTEKFPGIKIWVAYDGSWPAMVRISEVAQAYGNPIKAAINKFMHGQTAPWIEGANPQDYIYLHDFANFLHKERTGKELFWD